MSFINTIAPEQASHEVADLYRRVQGQGDYLPNWARVFSLRPGLMAPISELQARIAEGMSPRLWALVSLAVAREINATYCSLAYARRLVRRYFDDAQLLDVLTGSPNAPLSDAERAAMRLAVKMARDASAVTQDDIDAVRACGYTDTEVFDIVAAAAYRCFFAKIADALGAQPDVPLDELDDSLLDRLVVGQRIDKARQTLR